MANPQVVESVRQRILNEARRTKQDNGALLVRYSIERLLYRLSLSSHRERFVLKGAALYLVWLRDAPGIRARPTRDLDFWGSGAPDVAAIVEALREVVQTPVEEDGLEWPLEEVRGEAMREDADYEGARLSLLALLGRARIQVQIDFGFGDAITPAPVEVEYPTLLATSAAPRVRAYPKETVVAEKLQALVALGLGNTRLKDFFDLWTLAGFEFDQQQLKSAVRATFVRRKTALPTGTPVALTPAFTRDPAKVAVWKSFGQRNRLGELPELEEVAAKIEAFVMPLFVPSL